MVAKWFTSERRTQLTRIVQHYQGICDQDYGYKVLNGIPVRRDKADVLVEDFIGEAKADDRVSRTLERRRDARTLHPDDWGGRWGSSFTPVDRQLFLARRPAYYVLGRGFDPLSGREYVVIRPAGIRPVVLHVYTGAGSKNAKRKAKRYGKTREGSERERCLAALTHWMGSR